MKKRNLLEDCKVCGKKGGHVLQKWTREEINAHLLDQAMKGSHNSKVLLNKRLGI